MTRLVKLEPQAAHVNSLSPRKFFMLFRRLLIFFKINSFEKFLQEYHQSVKQFEPRTGLMFCLALSGSILFGKAISKPL